MTHIGERIDITHVIPRLVRGGALRSTLDVARAQREHADDTHCILSLGTAERAAIQWAADAGFRVVNMDGPDSIVRALCDADIVHLAAWNTPEVYAWLASPLPPMRLVMTLHITGEYAAQVAAPALLNAADWLVAATPHSLTLPSFGEQLRVRPERVHIVLDSTIMPGSQIVVPPHSEIRIGYAGTVDFVKMHPRFIELCAAAARPDITFPIAGSGNAFNTLERQAKEFPNARFEFLGYLDHVREFLATCDIFGYPLAHDTYAASELILQEAMWLGVPPVILAVGGLPYLVKHNETGMVAQDENEYIQMLTQLAANHDERTRLGANARAYARENFGAERVAPNLRSVYDQAIRVPKRDRREQPGFTHPRFPGAAALIRSFGDWSEPYRSSLDATDPQIIRAAESRIAAASPLEASASAGGVLDYRLYYSDDPMLCLWAGLTLGTRNRFALAAAEFTAAKQLGLEASRVDGYLERVMAHKKPFEDSHRAD